ncbi:Similar to DNA-directed RNA polymerase II subunit rpb4; acc. no. O74825 [Pyronema omphalodes CBS 100304]|uniref:Similar to DNA-directed RNA polymerase II subunit rpb4 acc. no. O74825 n=1 Tax=Pyronema omphalodes (strain CBS 100304) TaxID=1076935 RepID=U4LIX3_PYROM|nr:Similar to DNA-directed RNA polymerase II subunit rpb4; acc. no. O74825 [Pyronema omphalodes CBS 100304]
MSALPRTAREKEHTLGDEEAGTELKLGEFEHATALTLSEARALMNVIFEHRKDVGKVVTKTQSYLEVFSRFKQQETAQAIERILVQQTDLTSFERAQLGSLCCDSAEEAKTLIPSLAHKRTDEDLQELLEEITRLRQFL